MQFYRGVLLEGSAPAILFLVGGIKGMHHDAFGIQESQIYVALPTRDTTTARRLEFPSPNCFYRIGNIRIITVTVP